jgi:hypothetical protein
MRKVTPVTSLFFSAILAAGVSFAKEKPEPSPPPTVPAPPVNVPAAILDIANSADGAYPGGATPTSGNWSVDAGAKKLNVAPEPLLDSWLEFGPEIREKGATIVASGRAPGEGRMKSRFGAGLYGKNGFQLRFVPAKQQIELVRRSVVLLRKPFAMAPDDLCHLELSVRPERNHWLVAGRVWKGEEQRPGEKAFEYKIFAEELLFPLAGRSTLFATPFAGEPVSFSSAKVYYGEFVAEGE